MALRQMCSSGVIATGAQQRRACLLHVPRPGAAACSHAPLLHGRRATVCNVLSTSTNPAFTFGKVDEAVSETGRRSGPPMTVDGAVQKTSLLLAVAAAAGAATWMQILSGHAAAALAASKVGGIVAIVAALATMFRPNWAPATGLVFAVAKGAALAGFSAVMELRYPGIVLNALMLTFGTAGSLLVAYQARLLKVTDKFRDGVMMVTGGYFLTIMVTWLLGMVGVRLPGLFSSGPLGMGLGLVAAALAAANLLLDFDMIKSAARARMPKWFEWYSGFSLLLTLVWMYTEVLRLLQMFAGGRDD